MSFVTIHKSGAGAEALCVDSWYNGAAYAIHFGDTTARPFRSIFFQGGAATQLREDFDTLETMEPETDTRDIWFRVLDPYM